MMQAFVTAFYSQQYLAWSLLKSMPGRPDTFSICAHSGSTTGGSAPLDTIKLADMVEIVGAIYTPGRYLGI